jgi:hypothetical protein
MLLRLFLTAMFLWKNIKEGNFVISVGFCFIKWRIIGTAIPNAPKRKPVKARDIIA